MACIHSRIRASSLLLASALLVACGQPSTVPRPAHDGAVAAPTLRTRAGLLRGKRVDDAQVFVGIPYALPPVGERRWQPPRPFPQWSGERRAEEFGPACPQPAKFDYMIPPGQTTSEDCLTINVSAPIAATDLPVLVMIHGGGYVSGSGEYLMMAAPLVNEEDVVLVTFNYRLGSLGFLAHPELDGSQGVNYALMDMIAALRWVETNIAAFGGNPDRVTITGVSAGGMSVDLLMVADKSRDLISGAIAHSGYGTWPRQPRTTDVTPIANAPSAEAMGLELVGRASGKPEHDVTHDDLYALTPEQLVEAVHGFHLPIVDGISLQEESGILFALGRQHPIPYMSGGTSFDGSIWPLSGVTREEVLGMTAGRTDRMRALYAADFEVSEDQGISRFFGDLRYVYAAWNMTRSMERVSRPGYLYMFEYVPPDRRGSVPGSGHGADFDTLWGQPDLPIAATMREYWMNFVKTGDPNGDGLTHWPPNVGPGSARWLVFDDSVTQKDGIHAAKMAFVDELWTARVEPLISSSPVGVR